MKTKPMGETETHEFTHAHVCTGEKKCKHRHTHMHTHSALSEQFIFSVAISKGSILNTG